MKIFLRFQSFRVSNLRNWGFKSDKNKMKKSQKVPMSFKRKMKISEISEFSILPYTQNQKLGNVAVWF